MEATGARTDGKVSDDLSALAWVSGELRRSLEMANKALRRYLKEAEAVGGSDVDAVDPAVLRTARTQLHQGVGALELVGMPAVANVLRASEAAVQRMVSRPAIVDAAAVDTVERVSFALLDFLARQLAGKPVSPVMLFPQYRAALQLAAADRIHPADLWKIDWQWHELPHDTTAQPRGADDDARSAMETEVLALMREPGRAALARMSELCAELGAGARRLAGETHLATFWQLAAAVFDAQAAGLLTADVYSKRIASRLLAQLRMRVRGQLELSDRLAQDLLFFCSHARAPTALQPAPRLAAVRRVWHLDELPTADYETPRLGRFDPAIMALARKRVAAAKDSWSAVAGGELHRMQGLAEQFALVGESLQRLFPAGELLSQSLQTAVAQVVSSGTAPPAPLAMEVATGILYLDASLEDGEFDHPELAERVQRLARRIEEVRIGAEPQALDVWMEELYRRVSDRQTLGSVVQELRSSLSEIEKQIDQYFRDPVQRQVLIPVPAQLQAMRGVLSVLGLDHASQAALHMRDDVDALAQTEVDPRRAVQAGTFDRLADNLGALSFLIDMISVQPQLAKSLFRFDPETGSLSAVMGQSERTSAFAAFDEASVAAPPPPQLPLLDQLREMAAAAAQPELGDDELAGRLDALVQQAYAADQPELARRLGRAQQELRGTGDGAARRSARADLVQAVAALAPPAAPEAPVSAPIPPARAAAPGGTGLEDDAEMLEIFVEEAREVITDARAALERLADAPESTADLTSVRRAFHTLKGSSRMLGLRDFGEAGWACEQLYNSRLAQAPRMDGPLRLFTAEALTYLAGWTEAIAARESRGHNAPDVAQAADALRQGGTRLAIQAPAAVPAAPALEPAAEAPPIPAPPAAVPASAPAASLAAGADDLAPFDLIPTALDHAALTAPPVSQPRLEGEPPDEAHFPPTSLDAQFPATSMDAHFPPTSFDAPPLDLRATALQTLKARVPDLPSASDLELRLPELPASAGLVSPAPAADLSFRLDLGALGEGGEGSDEGHGGGVATAAPPLAPLSLPDIDKLLDLPLEQSTLEPALEPLPLGQALEVDLDDLDLGFMPLAAPPTLPPVAVPDPEPQVKGGPVPVARGQTFAGELPTPSLHEAAAAQGPRTSEGAAPPVDETVEAAQGLEEEEQVRIIGPLRIGIPLFNIYLNEADELSRRLCTELAEWAIEFDRHPVPDSSAALAHSLAGNSATVGYGELSALARSLEHALTRSHSAGVGRAGEPELFSDAADEIRRLLHQFAAGFLRSVAPELQDRLAAHERLPLPESAPEASEARAEFGLDAFEAMPFDLEPQAAPQAVPPASIAAPQAPEDASPSLVDAGPDAFEAVDAELFPIFDEEAEELLPQLQSRLREWLERPSDQDAAMACMRTLHTLKGGARLAGAMLLGEQAHELESAIERLDARGDVQAADVEPLLGQADAMSMAFDRLRKARTLAAPAPPQAAPVAVADPQPKAAASLLLPEPAVATEPADAADAVVAGANDALAAEAAEASEAAAASAAAEATGAAGAAVAAEAAGAEAAAGAGDTGAALELGATAAAALQPAGAAAAAIDWLRFDAGAVAVEAVAERPPAGGAVVRVRAVLLDRLVNQAGEVSITRARIDSDVRQLQAALGELTDSLERMRRQLRDIELQAETQIATRIEAAKAAAQTFDPLEMDRFTRFQELTRFMAESVNDVATLQRGLQRTLQSTEDELAAQARLTRDLQDDLLRTRMIEFESLSERLHRTVRQAAKELAKQVRLEIVGGAIEIDRGVLERMGGAFEHLLRNSVVHGIEPPERRGQAGKDPGGLVRITVAQSGNEVAVEIADDGAGIDLQRVRARAIERGLMAPDAAADEGALSRLIFSPGFSTAETVTELAGRGVGLDVVRAEVNAMGGRIETTSQPGKGTQFKLLLPLTTAVTQVVMLRCGELQVAVPSTLIEIVRRVPSAEVERAYGQASFDYGGEVMPFFWLAALLTSRLRGDVAGRTQLVVVIRSATQRVAVHVDEVVGNQEVVVKNVGPQLSRLPGLAGVTLLPSGAVALIYNPVALASLYGEGVGLRMRQAALPQDTPAGSAPQAPLPATPPVAVRAPLVMVVDDSLTVRRVTQRLLVREGYRVVTAKDGLDALERLAEERPVVLLSDIEMPRMDGFDLLRNVRADLKLAGLPVIMITSRIAQKHRDYAIELGVDHYLGKPYSEEELLSLVARYAGADILA